MFIRHAQNTTSDCRRIFSLSNDSLVRVSSFNQNKIEYVDHCKWFQKVLEDKNILFFLIFADESEKDFIGQIRFKRASEIDTEAIISFSIVGAFRGKQIASQFIELGLDELKKIWYSVSSIVGEVKSENIASNKLFLKKGFELVSIVNTYKLNIAKLEVGGGGGG